MQARFLLGPAGSGKTFCCLAEIRAALQENPAGPPLIFLAPKQATFQIERQLLANGEISGFTRLHILSFDRLAGFILERLKLAAPKLLSGEGRLMILRALLLKHEKELTLFGRSVRRPGFAQELAVLLAELQQHQFTPTKLRLLVDKNLRPELRDKLLDLALLVETYSCWLREHELQDADCLLDFAAEKLRAQSTIHHSSFVIQHLWLDGFAEMTPQEMDLLAAVAPFCQRVTLAFCLETEPTDSTSWLSIWSAIGKTFQQCRDRIDAALNCKSEVVTLPRATDKNRFSPNSDLAALKESWSLPVHSPPSILEAPSSIRIAACANPETEAVFAAREILHFVRNGHRFRDCAVLVRNLEPYHQPLARIFRRYEIPFFLDRRESVAHHPLAELIRSALRTVAFDWQHDDWFAAIKTGFGPVVGEKIDDLENAALASGWRGKKWREPLPDEYFEKLRQLIFPPFQKFYERFVKVNFKPDGKQFADALRGLWSDLEAEKTLEKWSKPGPEALSPVTRYVSLHSTVWDQMNLWLENIELGFTGEPLPLRDWLPVVEAGLTSLTVGVIPPALDEVLIGAIDRARNPNLKFTLVLGVNETVFPPAPAVSAILTNTDRDELESQNAALGPNVFDQISRERYLGYIACTRASKKFAMTFSRQSADGNALNPSSFIARLQNIFPALGMEEFSSQPDWPAAEHVNELAEEMVRYLNPHPCPFPSDGRGGMIPSSKSKIRLSSAEDSSASHETGDGCSLSHRMGEGQGEGKFSIPGQLLELPALKSLAEKLARLREPAEDENLSAEFAQRLYGPVLTSSVSRLEEFAQCPFKFFVRVGLHAEERKIFELDARERGNFQHDVLKEFHEQLTRERRRWRDLTPKEARKRIGKIATAQKEYFRDGLLRDSPESVFAARAMTVSLQDFVEVIVGWMHSQYEFDPAVAELDFGGKESRASAWEIDLGSGRKLALQGRIDRVDLWRDPDGDRALAVVTDYKSGGKKLDALLVEHGVQLQLLAYLGALHNWKNPQETFGTGKLIPAGAFYVSLRGDFKSGESRAEVLSDMEAKKLAYRHNGRFDAGALRKLDRRPDINKGDQFNFQVNKDGSLRANLAEALPREKFLALLDGIEAQLVEMGQNIFSGTAKVDPYRKGSQTPCEYCDYRSACRLDEWTHDWRVLRAATPSSGKNMEKSASKS